MKEYAQGFVFHFWRDCSLDLIALRPNHSFIHRSPSCALEFDWEICRQLPIGVCWSLKLRTCCAVLPTAFWPWQLSSSLPLAPNYDHPPQLIKLTGSLYAEFVVYARCGANISTDIDMHGHVCMHAFWWMWHDVHDFWPVSAMRTTATLSIFVSPHESKAGERERERKPKRCPKSIASETPKFTMIITVIFVHKRDFRIRIWLFRFIKMKMVIW